MMSHKWWMNFRYEKRGVEIKQKLEAKPEQRQVILDKFKKDQGKISYYTLFEFLEAEYHLGIELEDWEEDALEGRLDRFGQAYIDFNEFNEFLRDYGYDIGIPLDTENNREDQLDRDMNQEPKDYTLDDKDYFMGSPTMFNSEKAALSKVRDIYKKIKREGKDRFIDTDFGPKVGDESGAFSLYRDGKTCPKGYPTPAEIQWVFSDALCDRGDVPKFLDESASADDCVQGKIGDCWFISAMSALAARDELIVGGMPGLKLDPDMIVDKNIANSLSNGVFPPIFHKYRSKGIYVLRIFKSFKWRYVIVDEKLPVKKGVVTKTGQRIPVFGSCKSPHEMWVALIEKAYAKMHGCYEQLISGYIDEGIQELTGFQPEKIFIRDDNTGMFPHKMVTHYVKPNYKKRVAEGFWNFLMERSQEGCLLGCSIKGEGKVGELLLDGQPCGLILNHAYAIQDVILLKTEDNE